MNFYTNDHPNTSSDFYELNSFHIYQKGVSLKNEDLSYMTRNLQILELKTPAMSSLYLTFENHKHQFIKGKLVIKAGIRKFVSEHIGDSPLKIYAKLENDIEDQLFHWKRIRNLNFNIDTPKSGVGEQLTGGYVL